MGRGGEEWAVGSGYPSPLAEGSITSEKGPLPKMNFSFEMTCFDAFCAAFFVRVLANVEFQPEVVIS